MPAVLSAISVTSVPASRPKHDDGQRAQRAGKKLLSSLAAGTPLAEGDGHDDDDADDQTLRRRRRRF